MHRASNPAASLTQLIHSLVSAPFRGTQVDYVFAHRTDSAPLIRPISMGRITSCIVHVGAYFAPFLPEWLNPWLLESRPLSYHDCTFGEMLSNALVHSDVATSRDIAPWDATFEASDERDADMEGAPCASTYYRSFSSSMVGSSMSIADPKSPSRFADDAQASFNPSSQTYLDLLPPSVADFMARRFVRLDVHHSEAFLVQGRCCPE